MCVCICKWSVQGMLWRQGDGGATSLSGQEETQSILQSLLCMQWPTMLPENKKPAEEFGECLLTNLNEEPWGGLTSFLASFSYLKTELW